MGKTIIKNLMSKHVSILLTILALLVISCLYSCGQIVKPTSSKLKFDVFVNSKDYQSDSIYLYFVLETMLAKHIRPFTPAEYYDKNSVVHIDSILYGPNKLRLIVLTITKVSKKLQNPDVDYKSKLFDFNANYFYCERSSQDSSIRIYDYNFITLGNYNNYVDAKSALFEFCFLRRATGRPWKDKEPMYNMDDIRFWNSEEFKNITSENRFIEMR
jgi:hypothetical protein